MKPSSFVHYEPTSLAQALVMLSDVAEHEGRVIAGGQTLVPAMALRLARPEYLVDINRIEELSRIEHYSGGIRIGACVRHSAFDKPVSEGALGSLLSTVKRHIAHLPIRNRGTFCGSLANADSASEWCLVATTLGAVLELHSATGIRELSADQFFMGFMTTALQSNELLAYASLKELSENSRFGFYEYSRRAGDFAQAMALVVYQVVDGRMENVRVGVGGIEAAPRRLRTAEACLTGKRPRSVSSLSDAAVAAAAEVVPVDAGESEQLWRRHLVATVVSRALAKSIVDHRASDQEDL